MARSGQLPTSALATSHVGSRFKSGLSPSGRQGVAALWREADLHLGSRHHEAPHPPRWCTRICSYWSEGFGPHVAPWVSRRIASSLSSICLRREFIDGVFQQLSFVRRRTSTPMLAAHSGHSLFMTTAFTHNNLPKGGRFHKVYKLHMGSRRRLPLPGSAAVRSSAPKILHGWSILNRQAGRFLGPFPSPGSGG